MDRSNSGRGSLAYRIVACLGTLLLVLPLVAAFTTPAQAQEDGADEVVIFVLDLSGSMNEPFDAGQTKLDVAKAAFTEAFANVSPDARVGLRTYGDQIPATDPAGREASCTTDTRIAAPVAPLQRDQLINQVQAFTALGDTPMGLAIQQASNDIPAGSTGTIVLFSDGRDECFDADLDGDPAVGPSFGQDPCEIAKSITSGDAAVDRVVTVGFRADSAAETELRCIADSTGGTYTAIETPEDARNALPQLLVQLSAPREAQRLIGREIQGATSTEDAPDLARLDELGAAKALYTDSIDMNSVRIYRMPEYGPEGGTFTATVFGLPPELGIALDMRIYIPELDQRFFQGQHGDFDAGLPQRPTASIRCTDCLINGGPYEAFFVVTLDSDGGTVEGTYELEILTEGPGFGGPTTSCAAPQMCFYPQEILDLNDQLDAVRSELATGVGEPASDGLLAERDRLRTEANDEQNAVDAANARALELEERIPLAPSKSTSFRLPFLMMLAGAGLALAPVHKLKRPAKPDDEATDTDGDEPGISSKRGRKKKDSGDSTEAESVSVSASTGTQDAADRARPSLDDVGPAPAVSPNLKGAGNNWDAELEAAKAALAQQRPDRPASDSFAAPVVAPAAADTPSDPDLFAEPDPAPAPAEPRAEFSNAQHAAAKAAAEEIAAQRAAEAASEQAAAQQAQEAAAAKAASEQAAAQQAQEAAAEKAAAAQQAQEAAAAKAASEQAAAAKAAQDKALAQEAAAAQAAQDKALAQEAAREVALAQQAAREAVERAEAERATAEAAAREAAAKAAAEKAAREAAERAAAEKAAREAAERAAAEKAAVEKAAAEKAAAEAAARAAAERAAAEKAAREAAERAAAEKAAVEKAAAEKAAAEAAARAAAERLAAEKAAADKAAAERLAAEAAARVAAEQAAADRAAAEKAAADRIAAEQATAEAAAKAAADKAAAEKAAADRATAELAAAQAAAQRVAAEEAAKQAAAALAAEAAQAAAVPASQPARAAAPTTEEERRQEARRRMLAKQNIVASSSGTPSGATTESSAGTAAALRPMTVPPKATGSTPPVERRAPEAPGWYEDPAIVGQFRWWDGATWTGHTSITGQEPAPS